MADLLPLLRQSIDWFESLVREQEIMSKVRSSELEIGLSSNDGPVEAGSDTAVSAPWEDRAFNALDEVCGLDTDTLSRFKDRFQFPDRIRFRLPAKRNGPAISSLGRYVSTRLLFCMVLGFPSTPLS